MKKNVTQTAQASLPGKEDRSTSTKALPVASAQIRIPSQRPIPQLNHHIKRETQQVTKEWTAEVSHTNQVSSHLAQASKVPSSLACKRIQRFHQKKTASLLKKMAELHDSARRKVDHKVTIVSETNSQELLQNNQDELWRDMMKPHEERHFQIGRITNFFS